MYQEDILVINTGTFRAQTVTVSLPRRKQEPISAALTHNLIFHDAVNTPHVFSDA